MDDVDQSVTHAVYETPFVGLHRFVIDSAARYPQALAAAGPCGMLRYAELNRLANAVAHQLAARGVGLGDRVVIWSGKSLGAIVTMQAVLRLGAAYVPASAATPAGRVAVLARDCAARVVCADSGPYSRAHAGTDFGADCVDIDTLLTAERARLTPVDANVAPDDLAYILYTSGSTGAPKGVSVSHRAARAFVEWAVAELGAEPTDRFANHAPFTFDLSVLDLYAAFAVGATVCPVPTDYSFVPGRLVEFLHEEQISIWFSVPSVLMLMMRDGGLLDRPGPESLRAVLFGGEAFPIHGVRQLADWTDSRLLNLYGPTETNACTCHEVVPADLERDLPVPIGRQICGDRVWAVRLDGAVAGPGQEGELLAEGPTVFNGYWGQRPHTGPYATGDIVRMLSDGSYDYIGRKDHRLKIRGHRIEPGEVETALQAHADVAEAAVIGIGDGLHARLVAFVAKRPGSRTGALALRRHLAERLPTHMIPDEVRFVARLPTTPRGKLDRARLACDVSAPVTSTPTEETV